MPDVTRYIQQGDDRITRLDAVLLAKFRRDGNPPSLAQFGMNDSFHMTSYIIHYANISNNGMKRLFCQSSHAFSLRLLSGRL